MAATMWVWLLPLLSDGAQATAIATVLSTLIAGGFGYVTVKSSAKRTEVTTAVLTRTDIEKEAFERAKKYYEGALDRQDEELKRLQQEIDAHETEITQLKSQLRKIEREKADEIAGLRALVERREAELETAKKLLALKYPDE